MVRSIDADVLVDAGASLGEGPHWDVVAQRLHWVDIDPGEIHELDPATGETSVIELGPTVGAVVSRADGGLAVAAANGFAMVERDGTIGARVEVEPGMSSHRMNDGKCDPAGRFWAGSMVEDRTPHGALYRLDADLSAHRVIDGVTISNGLAWTIDGRWMYFIDSPTGGVDRFRFDLASGAATDRTRLVDVAEAEGAPDGMTLDAEGCLWVAVWGAGQIRRYTPEGVLDAVVTVPASLTTSCCFGGPGLDVLYITSATCDLSPAERAAQPHAGAVFACWPGVSGRAATPFAGPVVSR